MNEIVNIETPSIALYVPEVTENLIKALTHSRHIDAHLENSPIGYRIEPSPMRCSPTTSSNSTRTADRLLLSRNSSRQ